MIKDKDVLIEVVEKDGTLIEPKDANDGLENAPESKQDEVGTHIDVNFNDITSVKEKLG